MKFTRELTGTQNVIRNYGAEGIRIGEHWLRSSVLVSAEHLIAHWTPQNAAAITLADFEPAFAWQPEIILLGTGSRQVFPPREVYGAILSRSIGFEVMDTGAACRTYNVLVSEARRVVAALIL